MFRSLLQSLALAALALALLSAADEGRAFEIKNFGGKKKTLGVSVTNTAIGAYRFDNRNDAPFNPRTRVDDDYAEIADRLNVQATWWKLRLDLRLDAAAYPTSIGREDVPALADEEVRAAAESGVEPPDASEYRNRYYRELHSRFLDTLYPAKISLGYTAKGIDVTAGDFYAQLGRGFVFSVRKIDELAIDTTVRGAKIVWDHAFKEKGKRRKDGLRAGATLLAGQMNPLRLEETSGRRLHGQGSPFFLGFPESGPLRTYDRGPDGQGVPVLHPGRPNYLEDSVFAGRVEGGIKAFQLAGNASLLLRESFTEENLRCRQRAGANALAAAECDGRFPDFVSNNVSRMHNRIVTYSGSLNVPSIAKSGDLYAEVAGQDHGEGHLLALPVEGAPARRTEDVAGYAAYVSGTVRGGPVSASLEGKHYRRFFPLAANVDTQTPGFSAPEYDILVYSQPPTAEAIYVEPIGNPNTCITGGRSRVDYRFRKDVSAYGWLGRHVSYSEVDLNTECVRSNELRSDTWDAAVGTELSFDKRKSTLHAWAGARFSDRAVPSGANVSGLETAVLYREGYVRYNVTKHLGGSFAVQAQGFHRRRYQPKTFEDVWYEGENYTALQVAPHYSFIFGYEYLARQGCRPSEPERDALCHYVSGGFQYKSNKSKTAFQHLFDTVQVFVGQRRGAVRCVSGVCRQFPPFEGARVELVSRF